MSIKYIIRRLLKIKLIKKLKTYNKTLIYFRNKKDKKKR